MFKKKNTQTIAMCMYVACATPQILYQKIFNSNKNIFLQNPKMAHATNMLENYIYARGFWICGMLSLSEKYNMCKRKHQNNCNMHVFLMLHTKTMKIQKTKTKNIFFKKNQPKTHKYLILKHLLCNCHFLEF